jgi:hypothetical protein
MPGAFEPDQLPEERRWPADDRPDRHSRRLRPTLIGAAIVALLALGAFYSAGETLVAPQAVPRGADIVLVKSDYNHGERLAAGLRALQLTGARRLVVFLDRRSLDWQRAQVLGDLARRQVSTENVRLAETRSDLDQARLAAGLAHRCGWRTVVVATSNWNTRRVRFLFGRALGHGVSLSVVGTHEGFRPGQWWRSSRDRAIVRYEWPRLVVQSLRYALAEPAPRDDPSVPC